MGMTVNTNNIPLETAKSLNSTDTALSSGLQRLSAGLERDTATTDDAARTSISDSARAQRDGTIQSTRNLNNGISMAQTAGSGLQDIRNILDRMRPMAVESSDETLDDEKRSDLNGQFQQLKQEVDLIAGGTSYNGVSLLNGDASEGISIEVSRGDTQEVLDLAIAEETGGVFARQLGKSAPEASSLEAQTLATTTDAQRSIGVVDQAIGEISRAQRQLGEDETRLQTALQEQEIKVTRTQLENTQARDFDFAQKTANTAREQILQQSGAAVLAQAIGLPQVALGLLG